MNKNHYVIIMAGGIGSRFWPASRQTKPKQFLDILGIGKSLINLTYQRFADIVPVNNILIVTNTEYVSMVMEHIPTIQRNQILTEPTPRNTAPCVAYASHFINQINPNAVCLVAPSDHLILDETAFKQHVLKAYEFATNSENLITFGIQPTRPDTGYGYIQMLDAHLNKELFKVKTFTEKPTEVIAKEFIETGEFLWNAGIFCWSIKTILNCYETHLLDMFESFGSIDYNGENAIEQLNIVYESCQNISLDYGILEKDKNVYVLPSSFGWSDLGTWKSLYDCAEKENTNAQIGQHILLTASSNTLVYNDTQNLVVTHGLTNIVVVVSGNSVLVIHKEMEQDLRKIVSTIKAELPPSFY